MDPGLATFTVSASKIALHILLFLILLGVLGVGDDLVSRAVHLGRRRGPRSLFRARFQTLPAA